MHSLYVHDHYWSVCHRWTNGKPTLPSEDAYDHHKLLLCDSWLQTSKHFLNFVYTKIPFTFHVWLKVKKIRKKYNTHNFFIFWMLFKHWFSMTPSNTDRITCWFKVKDGGYWGFSDNQAYVVVPRTPMPRILSLQVNSPLIICLSLLSCKQDVKLIWLRLKMTQSPTKEDNLYL